MSAATRRTFLRGFTAFSAGAVALAAPVAQAAPAPADAELLRLGADLTAALAVYDDAFAALTRCREAYEAAKPEIPASIQAPQGIWWCETDWPPSFTGAPCPKHVDHRVRIPARYDLDRLVKTVDGRTLRGRAVRRLKRETDAYHAARDAVLVRIGADEAGTAAFYKGRDVVSISFAIMAVDAATIEGLAVKGRAGLAMQRVWANDGDGWRCEQSYERLLRNLAALGQREGAACL